jgi:methionyl-tRNA synthetase
MKNFYITTTIPYVNADPHIGFALEIIQADSVARYKRQQGYKVCFNFGTDEHGLKIYRKAVEKDMDPKKYCDEYARKFDLLKKTLNLSYTNFIRTTDQHHIEAAQEFWKRCDRNGDIYKKKYRIKYCVGCELEKSDSELDNSLCPLHPNLKLEIYEEENYFFRFSKYQTKLLDLYNNISDFVIPKYRLQEIENFVKKGLEDFSISRLKKKMPWGIDVPGDSEHVMYVWFDALINYISTIGWPENIKEFNKWWPVTQIAGKDNLRQQSAIWQAMLMSAKLLPSKQIFIHGFITSEGKKISKSLGNSIDPFSLVSKYGTDALRYYLLREIPSYSDGDFSERRFKEIYNADLANGLGNLVARIAKLCEKSKLKFPTSSRSAGLRGTGKIENYQKYVSLMEQFKFNEVMEYIWDLIDKQNKYIDGKKPWKLTGDELEDVLIESVGKIREIAFLLQPFLPKTSDKITQQLKGPEIKSSELLFPRIK